MRLIEAGQLEEAAVVLGAAAPRNRSDVPLHHLFGDVLAQFGRGDEAITAWQAAVDADPSADNLSKLGVGMIELGRFDEAESTLRRAQQINPAQTLIHYYLGENALRRNADGDRDLARQEFQAYLDKSHFALTERFLAGFVDRLEHVNERDLFMIARKVWPRSCITSWRRLYNGRQATAATERCPWRLGCGMQRAPS